MAQPTDPSVVETGTVQDGVVLPNRYKSGSRCRSSDEELELMEAQEDNGGTWEKHTQLFLITKPQVSSEGD